MSNSNSNANFFRRKAFWFILAPIGFIGIALLMGWVVMWLWNAILPSVIVGVSIITYWQAVGLLILSRILFGGIGGRGSKGKRWGKGRGPHLRERWMQMSDADREQFRAEWQERCRKRDDN